MFWKTYILWISLFQITMCYETENVEQVQPSERSEGSYKILNRKPQVNKRGAESQLVFPGLSSRSGDDFKLVVPEACQKIGICEDIPNYPEELVNKVLEELLRRNNTRFNKDVLTPVQFSERIGSDSETLALCESVEKIYAPRAALDINKDWFIVLNNKVNPQQTFRVEICADVDSSCNRLAFFQHGYKGKCQQKVMLRQMMAINKHNDVVERPFEVPSCCSCVATTV